MKIILAGGSGFLGKALTSFFEKAGHQVVVLTRSPSSESEVFWDGKTLGSWTDELNGAEVLINLTGRSVDCRYNARNKFIILSSRIRSTRILQRAIDTLQNPPKLWINASSATIYTHAESQNMTEDEGVIGDDFSMRVCKLWEKEFFSNQHENVRKVTVRTSIVLGNKGGAFPKMKVLTRLFLGGSQGSGSQYISWIHIEDFCRAISFIINQNKLKGVLNITSPNPVRNRSFMKLMRKRYNRPFGVNSPVWLLELGSIFMKTQTELLLKSRKVVPERLLKAGFTFKYPNLGQTLEVL